MQGNGIRGRNGVESVAGFSGIRNARYQGQEAAFSIPDGTLLAGEIPTAKIKLVQAWIEIHKEDLLADWELAVTGQPPLPIDPLR